MSITLDEIGQVAVAAGLDLEGAQVAMTIAQGEGGMSGSVGDGGTSFGPFQFHYYVANGSTLFDKWAAFIGETDWKKAGNYAILHMDVAAAWALNGYLGASIRAGQKAGYHGAELARYVKRYGQGSASSTWDATAALYHTMWDAHSWSGWSGVPTTPPDSSGGVGGTQGPPSDQNGNDAPSGSGNSGCAPTMVLMTIAGLIWFIFHG